MKKVNNTKKYPYVFEVVNGIVRGVYKVDKWEKYPEEEGRFRFEGTPAENEIWRRFTNHRIPKDYMKKGMASPVLYSKNKKKK